MAPSETTRRLKKAGNGATERKSRLASLASVPIALALVAGVAIGVFAESRSLGLIAILVAIPAGLLIGFVAGRVALGIALRIRDGHSAVWLDEKLEPIPVAVSASEPVRIDIVHPAIDLKHFFGGFITVFNLARRLMERGHRVRIVTVDQHGIAPGWREQIGRYEGIGDSAERLEHFDATGGKTVPINPGDRLIATHWTAAHLASGMAAGLDEPRIAYLIQEYEPFIFPMGSAAALAEQSYGLDHSAIFSTELLEEWFRREGIGVFAAGGSGASTSFRNAITPTRTPSREDLEARGSRRLLFYARPEPHAARNLFEIGIMALDLAAERGTLDGWEIHGIGNLGGETRLRLPRSGKEILLLPRTGQNLYAQTLAKHDVGLALMHTPHPSLVPIEMAAAGMVTVTSTFANKDAAAMAAISPNLLAVPPVPAEVARALGEAVDRSGRIDARIAGASVDWPEDWDSALDDATMSRIEDLL